MGQEGRVFSSSFLLQEAERGWLLGALFTHHWGLKTYALLEPPEDRLRVAHRRIAGTCKAEGTMSLI